MRRLWTGPGLAATLLVALAMWVAASCAIAPAWGDEATGLAELDLTSFYQAPSPARRQRLLMHLDALRVAEKRNSQPLLIGFFAGGLLRYPAALDQMIPGALSPQMSGLLAVSLQLAGQQAKAQSLVATLKSRDAIVPDLARTPSRLDAVQAVGPADFDLLWGASFATGDPRYSSRILARLAGIANAGDTADDLVHLVRNTENGEDQQWIVAKRGRDGADELLSASTALWSLHSNALRHAFVRDVVNHYVTAHPDEQAAKALTALSLEYGHYRLDQLLSVTQTSPGKPSVSVNIAYFSQILDDLERHAGSYPAHFEFTDDRQRAEHDVLGISKMLDPLIESLASSPPLLLRLAVLHSVGHNLDVPDSAAKAVTAFNKLLSVAPQDPQANYRYGAFLAATTRKGEGIAYLEKAQSLGVSEADYWLGLSYQLIGNRERAVADLEAYTRHFPSDARAAALLDAIRNGKVQVKVTR